MGTNYKNFAKSDKNKLRYDLIPPEVLKSMAEVLTYGANKYKANNWKKCEDINRYIAALFRHLQALRFGEVRDKESGLKHTAHILANALFIDYLNNKDS